MPQHQQYDLVIIGGGINGTGIARDAAGRGYSVLLCERDDLASHTSSSSSKLIHGGLRYLEHYAFGLVSKALAEREVLLRAAPHIIWPLRFIMPHDKSLRPAWLIRIGLFLYDWLAFGKRKLLPGSKGIKLNKHLAGAALQDQYIKGFEYSDAWVQDARLVVLNAMDAAEHGAEIQTRTACMDAQRGASGWTVQLQSSVDGSVHKVQSRCLVNAAGPWVSSFLDDVSHIHSHHQLRQIKGSHIVVPKIFSHDYAYIFQNIDKRIVFAMPYEGDYTLIGTTELNYPNNDSKPQITTDEVSYLCSAVNRYFKKPVTADQVVWSYAGVRPLVEDSSGSASEATRDYILDLDTDGATLLSVFGGKITTYRKLAEEVMDMLGPVLGNHNPAWTGDNALLPGGDIAQADFTRFVAGFRHQHPWLPEDLALRLAHAYGTRVVYLIDGARDLDGLGEHLGDDLYAAEIIYLIQQEWAITTEDILWRRSKLGLHVSKETVTRLENWLKSYFNNTAVMGIKTG